MRRFLMSALLLFGCVSLCQADYIVIRVVLNSPQAPMPMPAVENGKGGERPMAVDPMNMVPAQPLTLAAGDYVTAVVEIKNTIQSKATKERPFPVLYYEHKWGRTTVHEDKAEIFMQHIDPKVLKNPMGQLADRRKALVAGKDQSADRWLELAGWCLEVGLPEQCRIILNQLEGSTSVKDGSASEKVKKALAAYAEVKPTLDNDITKKNKAEYWQNRLRFRDLQTTKHYALLHNSDDPDRDGIQRRLDALEQNYKSFYLLFALKGKALPAPAEKLPAVLIGDQRQFGKVRMAFEVRELISDGFHARAANLAVFTPHRLDSASKNFAREMEDIYRKNNLELLKGQFPIVEKSTENVDEKLKSAARAQVLALVEVALREEAEIASATHEGARQLIAETGLLPHNTAAPDWLRFGLASLFEMPKGPFPGKNTAFVKLAFWPGAGGPNWAWRRYLDEMLTANLVPEQPIELLYRTLTGYWADHAAQLLHEKAEDPMAVEEAQEDIARGRCLAWALSFYMFNDKFPELMNFLESLANQPRDIEYDQYQFLKQFCTSLRIDTTGLTPQALDGNLDKYGQFSKDWIDSVRRNPSPTVQLKLEDDPKVDPKDKDKKDPKKDPKKGNG